MADPQRHQGEVHRGGPLRLGLAQPIEACVPLAGCVTAGRLAPHWFREPVHWLRAFGPWSIPWLTRVVAIVLGAFGGLVVHDVMAEVVVMVGRAELCARPSRDGPVLTMLEDGERIEASAVRVAGMGAGAGGGEEWLMVAAPAKAKVWISVGAVDLATGKVRGEPAFLRAGPGVLCPAVGQVPKGTTLDTSERLGLWLRIESPPSCVIGYVRSNETRRDDSNPLAVGRARMSLANQPTNDGSTAAALPRVSGVGNVAQQPEPPWVPWDWEGSPFGDTPMAFQGGQPEAVSQAGHNATAPFTPQDPPEAAALSVASTAPASKPPRGESSVGLRVPLNSGPSVVARAPAGGDRLVLAGGAPVAAAGMPQGAPRNLGDEDAPAVAPKRQLPANTTATSSQVPARAIVADSMPKGLLPPRAGLTPGSILPGVPTARRSALLPPAGSKPAADPASSTMAGRTSPPVSSTRDRAMATSAPPTRPRGPTGAVARASVTNAAPAVGAKPAGILTGAPSSSGPAPRSAARRNAGAPASQMGRPSRVATVAVGGANGPGNKAATNVAPILGDRRQTLPSSQGVVARSAAERPASSTMVGKTNTPGFGKGFSKAPVMTLPAATPSNRGRVATPESAAKPVSVLPASAPGQAAVPSSSASVVRRATRVGVIERVPGSRGSAGFWLRSLEPGRGSLGALEVAAKDLDLARWLCRKVEVEVDDLPQGREKPDGILRVRRIVAVH